MRAIPPIFTGFLTLFSAPADASTILGNPSFTIELVSGKGVYVDLVEATPCVGSPQTVSIDEVLVDDPATAVLSNNTFCSLAIDMQWSPSDPITTVAVGSLDELKVVTGAGAWTIELDSTTETATFVAI